MPNNLEPRVATLEGSLKAFIEESRDYRSSQQADIRSLAQKMDSLSSTISQQIEGVSRQTQPNISNMIAFAGVIIAFFGVVGGVVVHSISNEFEHVNVSITTLDNKLQREASLMTDNIRETAVNFDKSANQRDESLKSRLAHVEDFIDKRVQDNLNELQQRRLKDAKNP